MLDLDFVYKMAIHFVLLISKLFLQWKLLDNCPGNFEYWHRHISKGGWTFTTADDGWQVSDCTGTALKVKTYVFLTITNKELFLSNLIYFISLCLLNAHAYTKKCRFDMHKIVSLIIITKGLYMGAWTKITIPCPPIHAFSSFHVSLLFLLF